MNKSKNENEDETKDDSNTESSASKRAVSNLEELSPKINLNDLRKNNVEDEVLVLFVSNAAEDAGSLENSVTRNSKRTDESGRFTEVEVPTQLYSVEQSNRISQRLELVDTSIIEDSSTERRKEYDQLSANKNLSLFIQDTLESIMPTGSSSNLSNMRLGECCTQSIDEEVHNIETVEQQPEPQQPETLEPNNPLMARYQAALEAHLIRQNKKLDEELLDLVSIYLITYYICRQ